MEKLIRKMFLYFLVAGLCYNVIFQSRYVKVQVEYDTFQINYLSLGDFVFNIVRSSVIFTVVSTVAFVAIYYLWLKLKMKVSQSVCTFFRRFSLSKPRKYLYSINYDKKEKVDKKEARHYPGFFLKQSP